MADEPKPNVSRLEAVPEDKKERDAAILAALVAKSLAEFYSPVQIEIRTLQAMERRARYLEYVKQGFTPEQALTLCKS